jgi:hypothetical protein
MLFAITFLFENLQFFEKVLVGAPILFVLLFVAFLLFRKIFFIIKNKFF